MFSSLLNAISKHRDISGEEYDLLRDDNAYTDTGATIHHYDPEGVDYVASLNAKAFVEAFLTGSKWKDLGNGDTALGDARKYAKAVIGHANKIKESDYKLVVKYNKKGGRLFDDGFGTQVLSKKLRAYFQPASYRDYDMCNAHPTILLWVCQQLELSCERLAEYVNDREAVLGKSGKSKKDILTMINCDKHKASQSDWVNAFCDELVRNKAKVVAIVGNDYNYTDGSKHPLSSKMNKLFCDIENRCLHAGMQAVEAEEDAVLMFDGFMVQSELSADEMDDMGRATSLIGIKWAEKPWEKGVVPEGYKKAQARPYEAMKAKWEERHFIVTEPEFTYWAETSDGPRPISRQACQDASRKMWFRDSGGKREKLFSEWIEDDNARSYTKVVYIPHAKHLPPTLDEGELNTAKPFAFDYIPKDERDPNALAMFRTLLGQLSEDDAGEEYMVRWFAHMLQHPTEKPEIFLMFKSHGGTGKDTVTKTLVAILGEDHCATVADMGKIFGKFNSILANKLFITMNEVDGKEGVKYIEKLKNDVTEDRITIEFKNKDTYQQANCYRGMVYSNNSNPIPVDSASARRFLMNQVRADRQLPKAFFDKYYECKKDAHWVNSLASDLCDYDLTDFNVRFPPKTASMQSKLQDKIHPLHKLLQRLCEGKHADEVHTDITTKLNGKKVAGLIAIEPSKFNRLYSEILAELCPSGSELFMTDKKYIDSVFGNYNDIIFPKVRKFINGQQKHWHFIHPERMVAGLKNRREYTMPVFDDDDDEDEDDDEVGATGCDM